MGSVVVRIEGVPERRVVQLGPHFRVSPNGLTVVGSPTFEACEEFWSAVCTLEGSLQFAIGDAVNDFEDRWGERAAQIIDATGLAFNSVRIYAWVAKSVAADARAIDRGLHFSHHMAVAALNPPAQRQWLRLAAKGDGEQGPWSVSRLKAAIRNGSDLAPTSYWVVVRCDSERKQQALIKELEAKGLVCKAQERCTPKKKELTS